MFHSFKWLFICHFAINVLTWPEYIRKHWVCWGMVPSIGELASSPTIGHDLCVVYMQIWLANMVCLSEIHIQIRKEGVKSLWLAVSSDVWVSVNTVIMHTPPRTYISLLQLTWVLIVVGGYKIYCSNIECPIIREVYWSPESIGMGTERKSPPTHMKWTDS